MNSSVTLRVGLCLILSFLLFGVYSDPIQCSWFADPTLQQPDNFPRCGRTQATACRTIDRALNALFINKTDEIRSSINLCLLGRTYEVNESVVISPPDNRTFKWEVGSTLRIVPYNQLDTSEVITIHGSKNGHFNFQNVTRNVTISFANLQFEGFEFNPVFIVKMNTRVEVIDSKFSTSYRIAQLDAHGHLRFSNCQFNGGGKQSNSSWVVQVSGDSSVHFETKSKIFNYSSDSPMITVDSHSRLHFYDSEMSECVNSMESPILLANSQFEVSKGMFLNNQGNSNGGVISAHTCESSKIYGSTFKGNKAVNGNGGAIYASDFDNIKIETCVFVSNQAQYGGALAVANSKARIALSTFTNNFASMKGGGILLSSVGINNLRNNSLVDCTFNSNLSPVGAQISMTDFGSRAKWHNISVVGTLKNAVDCEGSDVCKPCQGSCKYCEGACISGDSKEICYSSKGYICYHGECMLQDELGFQCECQTGWQGPNCELGAPGEGPLLLVFVVCFFALLLFVTGFVLVWMWKRCHEPAEPEGEPFLPSPVGKGRWRPKKTLFE